MIKKTYLKELNLTQEAKLGSKGDEVKKIQEWINLWRAYKPEWFYNIQADGDFGQLTDKVVRKFQEISKLEVDGVVGAETFRQLTKPMSSAFARIDGQNLRELIVAYAEQHLVNMPRELYNTNQGPWVRAYMDGNEGREWAWCMGFVQTILDQAFSTLNQSFTSIMPHTYSCDVVGMKGIDNKKLIRNINLKENPDLIQPGDIFLVVKSPRDWIHTGIITGLDNDTFHTIEGNTNDEGSREGFEVCRRIRNFKTKNIDIYKVS